jgi:hypothetical protein
LTAALLFTSISVVSAEPNEPGTIDCILDITYDVYPDGAYWKGTVSGPECSVEGTIKFFAVGEEYFDAGKTTHFVEEFMIEPYSGGFIKGKNWGVWNFSTFKYRANGWVKETSPQWEYLVGAKYHEMGTTSALADGLPLTAPDGKAKIVPANRQNTP